jgi:hypothetical protein
METRRRGDGREKEGGAVMVGRPIEGWQEGRNRTREGRREAGKQQKEGK